MATVVIELDDRRFATGLDEQGLTHELHSKISADSRLRGQLRLFYPLEKPFLLPEEQRLNLDSPVTELEKWLEAKKINETLSRRLEEITCLYEIRRSLGLEVSLDNVCQHIFTHLVPAMKFPEAATAIIELEGRRFTSKSSHVQGLTHELQSIITINKRFSGQLRVFYPKDKPFRLPEEQDSSTRWHAIWRDGSKGSTWRRRWFRLRRSISVRLGMTIARQSWANLQIASIGFQAEALTQDMAACGSAEAAKVAASIATQAQSAVARCKEIAQGLLPFELETYGLMIALQALADRVAEAYRSVANSSKRMMSPSRIIISHLTFIGSHRKPRAMR